jgi:uncharacterized surface protein with fasciclin (FAS1) repeats
MKRISKIIGLFGLMMIFMLLIVIWGCRKETLVYNTTSDVNMTAYLDKYPDTFSEFRKILDLTGNASYLGAYGAYTLFAPNNDAIKLYLQDKGKTTVDQLDVADLKNMVRFHLLSDTIRSSSFTDGKLPSLTMFGQYLITGSINVGGITKTRVNRQANLIQSDIMVGNGIIHVIDHVLQPATQSVAQLIENNPKYSIFKEILKETGFYDTLNILPVNNPNEKTKFLTLIAESDSVLKVAGFNSYAQLKSKYSNTGNPKNVSDSLHLFMAYHILYEAKYLADIASSTSQTTLAPLEILSSSLIAQTILINDVTYLGIHEIGSPLDRAASDNSATNGVLNSVNKHFIIKIRRPVRVDWDVCDFPEIRKLTAYYRKLSYNFDFSAGQPIKDIYFPGPSALTYSYNATGSSSYGVYQDFLQIPLGPTGRSAYIDMKTPLIVRGKYKVWVGYRGNGSSIVQFLIDGEALPKIVNFKDYLPSGTEAELESQGWKHYLVNPTGNFPARLVGVIDIKTTDRHTLRIQHIKNNGNSNWVDFIQFIPVADDQLYPKFNSDGSMELRPVVVTP